jgi:Flp pilus assembly protein CpaB
MRAGEPVLLDANRTPGVAVTLSQMIKAGHRNLAEGLDLLIRERC